MNDTDLLQAIYAAATDYAIVTLDNAGIVTSWNTGAERILGYRREEIVGQSGNIIFTPEDREKGAPEDEFDTALETGRAADERWHVRKGGARFWGEGVVTPIYHGTGEHRGFLKIMRDDSVRKRAEGDLIRLANFDALTGVANRSHFRSRLKELMAAMARSEQLLILQAVDLDFFKQVNDSLGHAAGDEILRQAVQRMSGLVRETDFIARMGGDEFAVLQPNAHSPDAGAQLAVKLREALSQPFSVHGREVRIGASIGIAVYPRDATEPEQLMEKADLALYRVKNGGRGGFSYFTARMEAEARELARNLLELRCAVANGEFWLAYQPVVDCKSGQNRSLEALLRCSNPVLSAYPIDKVIKLAAKAGLMPTVGSWVLSRASAQQREWQEAGLPPLRLCINFCPEELTSRTLVDQVRALIEQAGMQAEELEIEITERDIFDFQGLGITMLEELRSLGISIALDDFGNGYSSLSYLRRLPIDRLKLDREILDGVPADRSSCVIAKSMIDMAHALGLQVTAEGVESPEQADFLRRTRCDAMQGFLLSPPLPPAGITDFMLHKESTR